MAFPARGARTTDRAERWPSGVEVRPLSRRDYERLSEEGVWKRGHYDGRRGCAEVVAEPRLAHEWRACEVTPLIQALRDSRGRRVGSACDGAGRGGPVRGLDADVGYTLGALAF